MVRWLKLFCRSELDTRSVDFRIVLPWHDGLEPVLARGWTPAGPGWLERKEVIACVVITRGGSPNGSRRVARRAAASLTITLRFGSTGPGSQSPEPGRIDFRECFVAVRSLVRGFRFVSRHSASAYYY